MNASATLDLLTKEVGVLRLVRAAGHRVSEIHRMLALIASEVDRIDTDIRSQIMPGLVLDPDDELTDGLLSLQTSIRETFGQAEPLVWRTRRLLLSVLRKIANLRVFILEHDADYSPVSRSYDNVHALIEALDEEE